MHTGKTLGSLPSCLFAFDRKSFRNGQWILAPTRDVFVRKECSTEPKSVASTEEHASLQAPIHDVGEPQNLERNVGTDLQKYSSFRTHALGCAHLQTYPIAYAYLLESHGNLKALSHGKHAHHQMIKTGHDKSKLLGSYLVQMYIKCASFEDAGAWFSQMHDRNVFSWNLMMGVFVRHGNGSEPLEMFFQMQQEGVLPNKVTYVNVISACGNRAALLQGVQIHAQIAQSLFESELVVSTALINFYSKCGHLENAQNMFNKESDRDVILWNAIIVAYAQYGYGKKALQLYHQMRGEGVIPDNVTFVSILSICSEHAALNECKQMHVCIISTGLEPDMVIGNALISMYGNCGCLGLAQRMFDQMSEHDVISWNAMIAVYGKHRLILEAFQILNHMQREGVIPDKVTFLSILSACTCQLFLDEAKRVHAVIMRCGFGMDMSVLNALINMYGKCGNLESAWRIFDNMLEVDVVSWNAIISAYAQHGHVDASLQLFELMHHEGIVPDKVTFVSVLTACASLDALAKGRHMHSCVVNSGFDSDVVILNVLLNFYGKNGCLQDAQRVFDISLERDLVSWNAMIAVYAQHGHGKEALKLFDEMQHEGMIPDKVTFVIIIDVYANEKALAEGKRMHNNMVGNGLELDVVIATSLVNMYAKCGNLTKAKSLFDRIPLRNVISWNAMLSAYAHHGHGNQALQLFHQMQCEGIIPDKASYISIISACTMHASFSEGQKFHTCIVYSDFESSDTVLNALVNMYGKCGSLDIAQSVFDRIFKRDLFTWNGMLAAFSQHGHGKEALQLFNQMQHVGAIPDRLTFMSLLSSCSHAGLLDEGFNYLISMNEDHMIIPTAEHYDCMIDLFGRAGLLDVAEDLISDMPFQPSVVSWTTLVGACKNQVDVKRAERAAKQMSELDPQNIDTYVLLSNIYSAASMLEGAENARHAVEE